MKIEEAFGEDLSADMKRILFVCHGNPIYPPAKRCLAQHGVPFDSSKTARTITKADYDR